MRKEKSIEQDQRMCIFLFKDATKWNKYGNFDT
jgi:hypothetical protein